MSDDSSSLGLGGRRIVEVLDSASAPSDADLETPFGRFLAVEFVLRNLLRVLSATLGTKSDLDDALIQMVVELDDRKRFRNAPPERVSGASNELLEIVFEYVPGDAPQG